MSATFTFEKPILKEAQCSRSHEPLTKSPASPAADMDFDWEPPELPLEDDEARFAAGTEPPEAQDQRLTDAKHEGNTSRPAKRRKITEFFKNETPEEKNDRMTHTWDGLRINEDKVELTVGDFTKIG
ncbi:hypothetical protein H0H81_009088 [Sphagnurus paluster]|uniref:Uncharacterized protein n=1 Tax=Sphagnurus paluster TaxID=117069 RepID=A0A9P7FSA9_9AGAR|nr:hypothetical protein H0H81_009088 [Sphagnurus paluster]